MIAFQSSVPPVPLGAIDTASAVVIAMVLGAVVLVFWASRPSVIARYAVQNQRRPDDPAAQDSPAPPPSATQESKPSA